MLPKNKRLTTHIVKDVLLKGKIYHGEHFLLRYLFSPEGKESRYAVIIPKKLVKTAVGRNAYRRRIYSILQQETLPQYYLVALMLKKADKLEFDTLKTEITTLFKDFVAKNPLKKAPK